MDDVFLWDFCRMADYLRENDNSCSNASADLQAKLKELDDMLVHSSRCLKGLNDCEYPNCEDGKVLFDHIFTCYQNGCPLCFNALHVAKFHARHCSASNCGIPRCGELKERYLRMERKRKKVERKLVVESKLERVEMRMERKRKKVERKLEVESKLERVAKRMRKLQLREQKPGTGADKGS